MDSDNRGVSLEANFDLGFATLTLIPAYRRQEQVAVYYAPDFRYGEDSESEQLSGEARLSGENDRLKWVAGLYYFDEDQEIFFGGTVSSLRAGYYEASRESFAAFAQSTVTLTDRLRLIGGIRYTSETVDGAYDVREADPFLDQARTPYRRDPSPYVHRIRAMWAQMRQTIIGRFPPESLQLN